VKLSTRLLLPLLATVVLVMVAYGWWAHVQREANVIAESRREALAYTTALGLAAHHLEIGRRPRHTGRSRSVACQRPSRSSPPRNRWGSPRASRAPRPS